MRKFVGLVECNLLREVQIYADNKVNAEVILLDILDHDGPHGEINPDETRVVRETFIAEDWTVVGVQELNRD